MSEIQLPPAINLKDLLDPSRPLTPLDPTRFHLPKEAKEGHVSVYMLPLRPQSGPKFKKGHPIIQATYAGRAKWLERITVAKWARGTGAGTRVIAAICKEADRTGTWIALKVHPFEPEGRFCGYTRMEVREWRRRLIAFYTRHGFKRVKKGATMMTREPRITEI